MLSRLKNRAGATITVALLFFILCAAIGSVVLTAGTVAAGRVNRMSDTDVAYRSVISATGVLRDTLNGAETTVTRTKITTYEVDSTYLVDSDNVATLTSTSAPRNEDYTYPEPIVDSLSEAKTAKGANLLWDFAVGAVFDNLDTASYAKEDGWNKSVPVTPVRDLTTVRFNMNVITDPIDASSLVDAALEVEVTAVLRSDRTAIVTVSSGGYSCKIELGAQVAEECTEHTVTEELKVTHGTGSTYTRTDKVIKTERKDNIVRWTVTGVTVG